MTFDWFRRRYDQNEPEKTPAETTPASSESDSQPAADQPEELPQDEMLNWAKLAYENIRKRQQDTPPDVAPLEAPADDSESVPADQIADQMADQTIDAEISLAVAPVEAAEPVEALPVVISELTATVEPIATPDEDVPATIAPEQIAPEQIAPEPDLSEPVTVEPANPELATPLPFWASAEADRQARLAQLRETAIVEPEPPPPASSEPTAPVVPDFPPITLDEGFLWSAEVLAAQGRRPDQISMEEITWLNRLRQGLDKTRRGLVNQLRSIVGQGPLNQDAVMEIEAALLQADVGVAATDAIIEALQSKLRDEVLPPDAAIRYLKQIIRDMLDKPIGDRLSAAFAPEDDVLNVWLITGVNGAGKTTTIGKLAHIAQKSGYSCIIAAADTFRAAAVEQVKVWGERSGVEVIANPGKNTDPAAVVFDAIAAAQARGADLLLVDTAGRLQNKKNLMDELSKVRRIIDKKAPNAKVESLLVLDSTLGQNGLRQAEVFSEAAKLSGVVLTKLDGTAKGGIALAVVQQLGLPIRFIGAGEGIEDLRPFSSYEFVEALLNE
jgi:fused signal recognition particle receptor